MWELRASGEQNLRTDVFFSGPVNKLVTLAATRGHTAPPRIGVNSHVGVLTMLMFRIRD